MAIAHPLLLCFYPYGRHQSLMVLHWNYDGLSYKVYYEICVNNKLFLSCEASAGVRWKRVASAVLHFEWCEGCTPWLSRERTDLQMQGTAEVKGFLAV